MAAFCFKPLRSRFSEVALMLVRFDHIAWLRRKRESQHHVNGCDVWRTRFR